VRSGCAPLGNGEALTGNGIFCFQSA